MQEFLVRLGSMLGQSGFLIGTQPRGNIFYNAGQEMNSVANSLRNHHGIWGALETTASTQLMFLLKIRDRRTILQLVSEYNVKILWIKVKSLKSVLLTACFREMINCKIMPVMKPNVSM